MLRSSSSLEHHDEQLPNLVTQRAVRLEKENEQRMLTSRLQLMKNLIRDREKRLAELKRRVATIQETSKFKHERLKIREQMKVDSERDLASKVERVSKSRVQAQAMIQAAGEMVSSLKDELASKARKESKEHRARIREERDEYVRLNKELVMKEAQSRVKIVEKKWASQKLRDTQVRNRIRAQTEEEVSRCEDIEKRILELKDEEQRLTALLEQTPELGPVFANVHATKMKERRTIKRELRKPHLAKQHRRAQGKARERSSPRIVSQKESPSSVKGERKSPLQGRPRRKKTEDIVLSPSVAARRGVIPSPRELHSANKDLEVSRTRARKHARPQESTFAATDAYCFGFLDGDDIP
mmetsp:Transcript_5728/g.8872  ORF Transcript_5728/g.8872 Transcript_5728/m.8872 type:complete len:355 (-) Transcript_5728:221-1285(-)